MTTRRQFLVHAPLGVARVLVACNPGAQQSVSSGDQGASSTAPAAAGGAGGAAMAQRPLLANIPANAPELRWTPKHEDLVYTFGGATPRQRIKPGTRIITWTEDCFDGTVKTAADLRPR